MDDDQFIKDYKTAQYEFFKNLGYKLISAQKNDRIFRGGYFEVHIFSKSTNPEYGENEHAGLSNIKEISLEDSFAIKTKDFFPADQKERQEFYVEFFCKYPQHRKKLFPHIYVSHFEKNYEHLINRLIAHECDPLKALCEIPVAQLEISANNLNIEKFSNYLDTKKFTKTDLDKFWLKFLKMRKNQIQHPKVAEKVSQVLSGKYDEEDLKPYFDFFPFLKSKYHEVDLDIYDSANTHTISFIINYKKLSKMLCVPKWDDDNYEDAIRSLVKGIQCYLKIDDSNVYVENRSKKQLRVCFFHSNNQINEESIKGLFKNFFNHLKNHHQFKIDKENLDKWFLYNHLNSNVQEDKNSSNKKVKI